jgi:hypothetical protein
MSRFLKSFLAISLIANALFCYRDFCGNPDITFYDHSRSDAYLIVRSPREDYFVIEHKEPGEHVVHRYTAKCRDTLSWLDGITNQGHPMSNGCTYLAQDIGKTIAAGLMRKEGSAIVYTPWSQSDTVQTADVLDITSDEVIH